MSSITHTWHSDAPPAADVYVTRRNESKYTTLRYWDGARWFEIGWSRSRSGIAFTWPKKSRTRFPTGMRSCRDTMTLRKIGVHQGSIQWGEPVVVYDEQEVLAHLVKTGRLPKDWRTAFQDEMRVKEGGAA